MRIQCGSHSFGCVHAFVNNFPSSAPQLPQQQRSVIFGVFHDQDTQLTGQIVIGVIYNDGTSLSMSQYSPSCRTASVN